MKARKLREEDGSKDTHMRERILKKGEHGRGGGLRALSGGGGGGQERLSPFPFINFSLVTSTFQCGWISLKSDARFYFQKVSKLLKKLLLRTTFAKRWRGGGTKKHASV
jgi:hypothetical protein